MKQILPFVTRRTIMAALWLVAIPSFGIAVLGVAEVVLGVIEWSRR